MALTIGCKGDKAMAPATDLARRIRGLPRVTIGYGSAYARRNGRMVTIAKGGRAGVLTRLREAIALLPENERPEINEIG